MKQKQYLKGFFSLVLISAVLCLSLAVPAYAMTPNLSLSNNNDGDTVQITVNGDANSNAVMYYTKTAVGPAIVTIGTTNSSGYLSTSVSSSGYAIAAGSIVYVSTSGLSGAHSNQVTWPTLSANSGNLTLNQTGVVLAVGHSTTITASNNTGSLYLSNNSNPSIANANINGNQIVINALNYGSTVLSICSTTSGSGCVSAYVNVQNGNVSSLTFSQSNLTVAYGQTVQITISGGSGSYTVMSNSNSSVIQSSLSGSTVSLYAVASSGSTAITICSSDQTACGIINATAGSTSTSNISFSQTNPTLSVGQNLNISLTGNSSSSYYISSNSNSSVVTGTISGNTLNLYGVATGTASLTVCSSSGSCGTLPVTIQYTSTGGTFTLSQSSISLLVGQVLSITASGGTVPYTLSTTNTGNVFQASISGNIISITGMNVGSSTLTACSAGGACALLSITVNASGSGTALSFSQNNLSLAVGGITAITLTGSGGYYVSNSTNSTVASVQISGTSAIVTGLSVGSTNISICQSGAQCSVLFVSVSSTSNNSSLTFSQSNPTLNIGQSLVESIYGATGSNYYVSTNTSPTIVGLTLNSSQLTISGLATGTSLIVVCTSSTNCGSLSVKVSSTSTTPVSIVTTSLSGAVVGQAYNYQLAATGGSGNYNFTISSGSLPAGLTLASNGSISGIASSAGLSTFGVKVTDTSSSQTNSTSLSLNVTAATPTTPTPAPSVSSYPSGELIVENGTVYIVYLNTKVGFASADAFTGLGFSFANVNPVSNSGLTVSSKVVVTATGAHPRGTWLISGGAVYFLTPNGLIPVPDWSTFLNNGGQGSFIVPANSYDLSFAKLSLMVQNDQRLHTFATN